MIGSPDKTPTQPWNTKDNSVITRWDDHALVWDRSKAAVQHQMYPHRRNHLNLLRGILDQSFNVGGVWPPSVDDTSRVNLRGGVGDAIYHGNFDQFTTNAVGDVGYFLHFCVVGHRRTIGSRCHGNGET